MMGAYSRARRQFSNNDICMAFTRGNWHPNQPLF
jgi:hypothetical protein